MQESKTTHVTPKDFVLYAGLMISLYWSAVNVGILWFEYINRLFPDALQQYVDPFSGTIRFAMASLIIMVPIFIGLSYYLNNDIRAHEEKGSLWIRRWLIYISLLIAGVAVAGDLIALVNVFLAGEITVRFLLKVLTVFVIAGGGFSYYLLDIRGYWLTRASRSRAIGWVVVAAVIASIVAGFAIAGTPGEQRKLRFDQERVNNLSEIQSHVVNYWQVNQSLPESLNAIENDLTFHASVDPETQVSYEYERTGDRTFELCATFDAPSPSHKARPDTYYPGISDTETWEHGEGRHCFERTINPELYLKPTATRSVEM